MRPISIPYNLNCYFHPQGVVFTNYFEVRVLRALKSVTEGPSSNLFEVLMRPISVPNFGILTFILRKISRLQERCTR